VCPLRITGTDTALLFEAASLHAQRAMARQDP
jgi:hypothetical protein